MKTFIIAVLTADGLIAESTDQISTDWTSKEDKKFFRDKTKEAGVIVLGYNTYKTIGRPLPDRLNIVYASSDVNIEGAEITQKEPADLVKDLENRGFKEVAICGGTTIFTMFMEAGLVDKLYITIESVVFGAGMTLFNKKFEKKLELVSMQKLGEQTVLLEYNVIK
jgi:dihydrofolate reductase